MSHLSTRIVDTILRDLRCRRGFNDWWDDIDAVTQSEVKEDLMIIVDKELES